jgi:hypothetical protein
MPRGYRYVLLAFVGLLIGAAPLPKGQGAQSERADTERQIANALSGIDASLKEANQPNELERECDREKPNRKSDLCAQWQAADAAVNSALWAERSFYLGVAGTFIGFLTLVAAGAAAWFARDAARHTETGAIEAKRGANAAHDLLDLERAPFLSFEFVNGQEYRWKRTGLKRLRDSWRFDAPSMMRIRSAGRSTARITAIHREWYLIPPKYNSFGKRTKELVFPSPAKDRVSNSRYKTVNLIVGSDGVIVSTNAEQMPRYQDHGALLFHGYVDFSDWKEKTYRAGFAFFITKAHPEKGMHVALPDNTAEDFWYHSEWPHKPEAA